MHGLLVALAVTASPYAGSQACRPCHASQFERQSKSGHARALHRAPSHPLASEFSRDFPFYRPPQFRFQFVREGAGLQVRADDGKYVMALPLEWAFGAGDHAVTFVSKVDAGHYLEHAFTYYNGSRTFDVTPRHEELRYSNLRESMGQVLRSSGAGLTIANCFQCHSTGPVTVTATGDVRVTEAGVHCEACHGPGRDHIATRKKMTKPGGTPAEVNRFCGTCHRSESPEFNWDSVWNVRHQPPFLARSRCYTASGRLSCLTCHDPHDAVRRTDVTYYRGRCQSCHSADEHVRAETDCVACHMPEVAANQHLRFRSHWIQVKR